MQKNAMEGFAMSTVITSPEDKHIAESVGGGSAAEIIGGIAAIVRGAILAHYFEDDGKQHASC
ncbi:MAG: hypothetical protein P8164_12350 [Gammaproteobacteria bacterium]